jgi:V/A-type H+-transporting ATPase subunit C
MNGIEKIIARIEADGAAEVEAIKAESVQACEKVRAEAEKAAQEEYWKIFKKGTKDAEMRVERLGSVAALEAKKQILATKQEMVAHAFDLAVEKIAGLPEQEYTGLLSKLAARASRTGGEQIILSPGDRARYGKSVCIKANELLSAEGKTASLTLSEEARDIRGGLILSDGAIEVNCAIETLVELTKNDLASLSQVSCSINLQGGFILSNKNVKDTDYLFLSAMLRARETRMLTREKMDRMLDAPGFDEAAKLMADSGYPDMSGMNASQIDEALEKHRAAVFNELAVISPEPELVDAFRMKYDYHNAKVLIKAEGADVDGAYLLSDSGRITSLNLMDSYNGDDLRFVPLEVAHAITEAKGVLARTGNPQMADFVLDKAYFSELRCLAEKLSGKLLKEYVAVLIDSANLRATVRILRMGRDIDFLKSALIPGGTVSVDRLAASSLSGEGLAAVFSSSPLEQAAQLGAAAVSGGPVTKFELECDNAITRFMFRAKLVGFGDDHVIAYLAAMEREIMAARMILKGKLSGISAEIIRERLRESYV